VKRKTEGDIEMEGGDWGRERRQEGWRYLQS